VSCLITGQDDFIAAITFFQLDDMVTKVIQLQLCSWINRHLNTIPSINRHQYTYFHPVI